MPGWLAKKEEYSAPADKDTFVNKSILSLLRVLSKIRMQDSGAPAKFQVHASFKVAFTLLLLLMLSISGSFTFVIIINVYLLAVLSLMEAADIVQILKVSFVMALFTCMILLPAVLGGNTYSGIMITSKVFATITAVNILSHTTRWNAITSALKRIFVPDIFILVLDISIKYIVMLGDFVLNMLYALKLRSVGRNKNKMTSLSGVAGNVFIKSKEMAEDMYDAMQCRGFTGEYHICKISGFAFADLIYILIHAGLLAVFLYFERI